ncbi:MAG: T9SS type A sorting domain-containing protein [Bacteroidota bacterium]
MKACDTTPVLTASNVQSAGGGNFTVDFNICMGTNGSEDGFDLAMGCGLNILSVAPTSLVGAGGTATSSIAGNTVTFDCASCNAGAYWEPNDFIAGPCFAFTATVNGDPTGCNFTVTGINDGCLIIQTSWSGTVPGPCIADFNINGPGSHSSTTAGAGNNCPLRSSQDRIYAITLPCNTSFTFDLCGGASWDTYLYLGSTCCAADFGQNDDFCGLQSSITATVGPGPVYITVEAFSSGSGAYNLNVTQNISCPFDMSENISLVAAPAAEGQAVDVSWTVESEVDVDKYWIERSLDDQTYDLVENFGPKGIGPDGHTYYSHRDWRVKQDVTYFYRVHAQTSSGEVSVTDPVAVTLAQDGSVFVGDFFPNPTADVAYIPLVAASEGLMDIDVYDVRGALIRQVRVPVHAGRVEARVDLTGVVSGVYFARFNDHVNGQTVRKITVR